MKQFALICSFFVSFYSFANPVFLTMDTSVSNLAKRLFKKRLETVSTQNGLTIYKIDDEAVLWLTLKTHRELKKCGGFFLHESLDEANNAVANFDKSRKSSENKVFANYKLNNATQVRGAMAQVSASNISQTIKTLSGYKNRYYQSATGVKAARWIAKNWGDITKTRSDASVELFQHSKWKQPSVILTIEGRDPEVVVIGGHLDSIAGFWGRERARAPGADDNASGIATITEIIRVIVAKNIKPQKTLKFMGYAAEEVGLRGSQEIATSFKNNNVPVVGVLQLDMTNFKGSSDIDLTITTDYTNDPQNIFLENLLKTYLPRLKWERDKCGYACSDHASWHREGFPASMPFESRANERNRKIHTAQDTINRSQGHARHAAKFARLGLAFALGIE